MALSHGRVYPLEMLSNLKQRNFVGPRCVRFSSSWCTSKAPRRMLVLGIETSCDDTCVSLLWRSSPTTAWLLYNGKHTSDNVAYRGVMPTVAIAAHTKNLARLVQEALEALPKCPDAHSGTNVGVGAGTRAETGATENHDRTIVVSGVRRIKPNLVAVTRGPGMLANLTAGLMTAKGLALAWQCPLVGAHHMQAHALTPQLVSALERGAPGSSVTETKALAAGAAARERLTAVGMENEHNHEGGRSGEKDVDGHASMLEPCYPHLTLLVSGGHTQLALTKSALKHYILAATPTAQLALGNMLDHSAREILPPHLLAAHSSDVMYGRLLESFAFPSSDNDVERNYAWYHPPRRRCDEIRLRTSADAGVTDEKNVRIREDNDNDNVDDDNDNSWRWSLSPPMHMNRKMMYDFTGLHGQIKKIIMQAQERPHSSSSCPSSPSPSQLTSSSPSSAPSCSSETSPLQTITEVQRRHLARTALQLCFEHLASRVIFFLESAELQRRYGLDPSVVSRDIRTLVLAGGVAANKFLRHVLRSVLAVRGFAAVGGASTDPADGVDRDECAKRCNNGSDSSSINDGGGGGGGGSSGSSGGSGKLNHGVKPDVRVVAPPSWLCTDNAAMIAWTGAVMWDAGWVTALDANAVRTWPLDDEGQGNGMGTGNGNGNGILSLEDWVQVDGN